MPKTCLKSTTWQLEVVAEDVMSPRQYHGQYTILLVLKRYTEFEHLTENNQAREETPKFTSFPCTKVFTHQ